MGSSLSEKNSVGLPVYEPDVGEESEHRVFEIGNSFRPERTLIYVGNDVETNLSQQVFTGPEPSGSLPNIRIEWPPSAPSFVQRAGGVASLADML